MRARPRIVSKLALGAAALAAFAAPASASTTIGPFGGGSRVVFAQTDGLAGNAVVAYDRAADGTLSPAGCVRDDSAAATCAPGRGRP